MKRVLLLPLCLFVIKSLLANVTLPALVSDNMVLQRNAKINLWGWGDVDEKITIEFQKKQTVAHADKDGKWKVVLEPLLAGGPYEMVIKGKNTIAIHNILIGDVWLASGQSNMEFMLKNVNNATEEIETADYPDIRLFTVQKKFAFQPERDVVSSGWRFCSPQTVDSFSAVAYFFGRELYKRYKVPIGLIHTSWGGTVAEAWTSAEGVKQFPEFAQEAENISAVSMGDYDAYKKKKADWLKAFGTTDRGRGNEGLSWADVKVNTSDWKTMVQPRNWYGYPVLKGYSGIVWFRKEINVPAEAVGKPIEISLGIILWKDSAFFNGQFIGESTGVDKKRKYMVPGELVKAGRNVIAVRITGVSDFGGMVDAPAELYMKVGDNKLPLTGEWLYKTGPDISSIPDLNGLPSFFEMMPQTPTVLYNAMLAPLIPYSIKGVIWYQGESNADDMDEAKQYYTLFPAMIENWRRQWGYDLPFLFVQLAGYQPDDANPADYPWAHLREAQYKTLSLPNTGMATAIDIGEEKDIHPKNKQDVAKRLALAAEKFAYHENIVYSGPTYKTMIVEGDQVHLSFDNTGSGLWVKDKYGYIHGFAIAGPDKNFVWARAYQDGNNVIVHSDRVKQPIAIRYNWGNSPDGNLYNKENLPAVPFRTDVW